MQTRVSTFFSCSFRDEDATVNDTVRALCEGYGLDCHNVSHGSPENPGAEAQKEIAESELVVCVATKRTSIADGGWKMPDAVRDELTIASTLGKPVILLVEDGVTVEGMSERAVTWLRIERDSLTQPDSLKDLAASIERGKSHVGARLSIDAAPRCGFVTEFVNLEMELRVTNGMPVWTYELTRRIRFVEDDYAPIISMAGSVAPERICREQVPITSCFEILNEESSRDFTMSPQMKRQSATVCEAELQFDPKPKSGDCVQFVAEFSSPILNPVYSDELSDTIGPIVIDDSQYTAYAGLVPTHETEELRIRFRIPRGFDDSSTGIRPFVGSYSNGVDYIQPQELSRLNIDDGDWSHPTLMLTAEKPLLGHMYGVAWQPPDRPSVS